MTKKSIDELNVELDQAASLYMVGSYWLHYSGSVYKIVGHTIECNTNEVYITYKPVNSPTITFARSLKEWTGVNGDGYPRFRPMNCRADILLTEDEYNYFAEAGRLF